MHAFFQGDVAAAAQLSVAGEQLCRASGDLSHLVQMLLFQGQAAILTGDGDRATTLLGEALRVARQLDDRPAQFDLLTLLVWPASTTGQARLAAQLLGAAGGVQAQAAAGLTGPFEPLLATARQTVIDALGVPGFEAALRGRAADGPRRCAPAGARRDTARRCRRPCPCRAAGATGGRGRRAGR